MHSHPLVSAIIPARNEESNVGRSVRSIAAQPEILELIVVDDQSEDRTPEILSELSQEFPALQTIRVDRLPPGWLGKPHALVTGARVASGHWLLFTDADTEHRPGSLGKLIARAESCDADLLSVSPGQETSRWWEKAVIPLIFAQLSELYPFADVNNPQSPAAAANGQYILIRRATYESIGGYAAAPDAILEDVALADRVKAARGRLVFLPGGEWVRTRMYSTFGAMWQGWTKNLFLLFGRDTGKIRKMILEQMLSHWLPGVLAPLLLTFAFWGRQRGKTAVAGIACVIAFSTQQRRYRQQLRKAGFAPSLAKYIFAGAPLASALLLSSVWAHRHRGSISWKGRTYRISPAKDAL